MWRDRILVLVASGHASVQLASGVSGLGLELNSGGPGSYLRVQTSYGFMGVGGEGLERRGVELPGLRQEPVQRIVLY